MIRTIDTTLGHNEKLCDSCKGFGFEDAFISCDNCDGTGVVRMSFMEMHGLKDESNNFK